MGVTNPLTSAVFHESSALLIGVLRAWKNTNSKRRRREAVLMKKIWSKLVLNLTPIFRSWHCCAHLECVERATSEAHEKAREALVAEENKIVRTANAPAKRCWYLYSNDPGCSSAISSLRVW